MIGLGRWLDGRRQARRAAALARRFAAVAASGRLLREEVEEWAAEGRDRVALVGCDDVLSFRELWERTNRWARWAIVNGVEPGEAVALMIAPRPERTAAWIGLSAIGAVATFFDPTPAPADLARAIDGVAPRRMVVDVALLPIFEAAAAHLRHATTVWVTGETTMTYQRLDEVLARLSAVRLSGRDRRRLDPDAPALAVVGTEADGRIRVGHLDHGRLAMLARELSGLLGVGRDDRLVATETAPTLESLVAPVLALAVGAPCRLVRAGEPVDGFAPTVFHRDAAAVTSPVMPCGVIEGGVAEAVPDLGTDGPALRRWCLAREEERVSLVLDGLAFALPSARAPRS